MTLQITASNISEIKARGWTVCSMGLSKPEIDRYFKSTTLVERKATDNDYPLTRSYYPHLFHQNIAAIESPFNKAITNSTVEELFSRLKLGTAIKELLGWKECHLHLARLFTMGQYKYRGDWHRDFQDWDGKLNSLTTIQVALYLKDQDGFRVFKYPYDSALRERKGSFQEPHGVSILPLDCKAEYFDEIRGAAGTALFFSPGIIHQGNSFGKRLDYHLRFSCKPLIIDEKKVTESEMFDYVAPDFYLKDFNLNNDTYSPRARKTSYRERLLNTINYYTGAINLGRLLVKKNSNSDSLGFPWRYSHTANTIFQ